MVDYGIAQLVKAHANFWEESRTKKLNLTDYERKAFDEVRRNVSDFARRAIEDPKFLVSQHAEKLRDVAKDIGAPLEELAALDMDLETKALLRQMATPLRPGCQSPNQLYKYADGNTTAEENKQVYEHCATCRTCLRDIFEYYSTFSGK